MTIHAPRTTHHAIDGVAHTYGDNIDTDRVIPGKYTKTLDVSQLAEHVLEDLDPDFRQKVQVGDVLVAGENFGCGSSREQAPLALKNAGISVIIAKSFARIFYRNAINIGLPLIELPDHTIADGVRVRVDLMKGEVVDENAGKTYQATPLPPAMMQILEVGGLVNYVRKMSEYELSTNGE